MYSFKLVILISAIFNIKNTFSKPSGPNLSNTTCQKDAYGSFLSCGYLPNTCKCNCIDYTNENSLHFKQCEQGTVRYN